MGVTINLTTKTDTCVVNGLNFSGNATSGLVCQLSSRLTNKRYCEIVFTLNSHNNNDSLMVGVGPATKGISYNNSATRSIFGSNGNLYPNQTSYASPFGLNDVMGISVSNGKMRFWKNGTPFPEIDALSEENMYPSYFSGTGQTPSVSGYFSVFSSDLQYLPSGFLPLSDSGRGAKGRIPTPVILSTMPTALTRGFR